MIFSGGGRTTALVVAGAFFLPIVLIMIPAFALLFMFAGTTSDTYAAAYAGAYERGDTFSNEISTARFVAPDTKNNLDLANYATQAWANNWGYVWGTFGNVLTESSFVSKMQQYPSDVGNFEEFIRENWIGRRTTDCGGLIKSYVWFEPENSAIRYSVGMPDWSADQMFLVAQKLGADNGPVDTIPNIPGLILWMPGHTGVYIGNGVAIEARGTKYGVVRTEVSGRGWQSWYKLPYITYFSTGQEEQ